MRAIDEGAELGGMLFAGVSVSCRVGWCVNRQRQKLIVEKQSVMVIAQIYSYEPADVKVPSQCMSRTHFVQSLLTYAQGHAIRKLRGLLAYHAYGAELPPTRRQDRGKVHVCLFRVVGLRDVLTRILD